MKVLRNSLIAILITLAVVGLVFVFGTGHPLVTAIHHSLQQITKA